LPWKIFLVKYFINYVCNCTTYKHQKRLYLQIIALLCGVQMNAKGRRRTWMNKTKRGKELSMGFFSTFPKAITFFSVPNRAESI
jgi:hypothetical protein